MRRVVPLRSRLVISSTSLCEEVFSSIRSSLLDLTWWAARGLSKSSERSVHVVHPYSIVFTTFALRTRIFNDSCALDRLQSWGLYVRRGALVALMRRLISMELFASVLIAPPREKDPATFVFIVDLPPLMYSADLAEVGTDHRRMDSNIVRKSSPHYYSTSLNLDCTTTARTQPSRLPPVLHVSTCLSTHLSLICLLERTCLRGQRIRKYYPPHMR